MNSVILMFLASFSQIFLNICVFWGFLTSFTYFNKQPVSLLVFTNSKAKTEDETKLILHTVGIVPQA